MVFSNSDAVSTINARKAIALTGFWLSIGNKPIKNQEMGHGMLDTLVSVSELAKNLDNSDWRIMDCRFSLADVQAGQRSYVESHIPGAHYISLDADLSNSHIPGKTGRHPLPKKSDWIASVQALGLTPQTQVILYDDAGGAMAARMWWMLRWIGHENAAVLNGGWQAWQRADLEVNNIVPQAPAQSQADYSSLPTLVKIVEADALDSQQQLILDAREIPRYRGDTEPLDPVAGHIPGAQCSPYSGNLDSQGCFLSPEALQTKFSFGNTADKPVVCYCGSGVTAAHNILSMKIAGFDEPALYPGSWSEWITDPSRAVATGDEE